MNEDALAVVAQRLARNAQLAMDEMIRPMLVGYVPRRLSVRERWMNRWWLYRDRAHRAMDVLKGRDE